MHNQKEINERNREEKKRRKLIKKEKRTKEQRERIIRYESSSPRPVK